MVREAAVASALVRVMPDPEILRREDLVEVWLAMLVPLVGYGTLSVVVRAALSALEEEDNMLVFSERMESGCTGLLEMVIFKSTADSSGLVWRGSDKAFCGVGTGT